jgi:nucleoside-triphosphatase THEP1
MAKMYPPTIDSFLVSEAEVIVFNTFNDQLSDSWTIFHGQKSLSHTSEISPLREVECDFILMHKDHGVMVVEVKGGISIVYDEEYDSWLSTNKKNQENNIKNPYKQVRGNLEALLYSIRGDERFYDLNIHHKLVNFCYCVVFPEVDYVSGYDLFEKHEQVTLLKTDLEHIEKKLVGVFNLFKQHSNTSSSMTCDVIDFLIEAKTKNLQFKATLKSIVDRNEKKIYEATQQQYDVLKAAKYLDRIMIYGCAGSGKTLIATKLAEDFSKEGKRVLLLCYNMILGSLLFTESEDNDCLTISIYHDFIKHFYTKHKHSYDYSTVQEEEVLYFVLEHKESLFDVLIIDEGQDLSSTEIESLMELLDESGKCFIMMDENQRVNFTQPYIPEGFQKMVLNTNLRNSTEIFDVLRPYYFQEYDIFSKGPEGIEVEFTQPYQDDNPSQLYSILRSKINTLVNQERVKYSDIAILTMKSIKKSSLDNFNLKSVSISKFDHQYNDSLLKIETVRRFKGVESKIVIVTELDGLLEYEAEEQKKLLYTAFSRAKHVLIVVPSVNSMKLLD